MGLVEQWTVVISLLAITDTAGRVKKRKTVLASATKILDEVTSLLRVEWASKNNATREKIIYKGIKKIVSDIGNTDQAGRVKNLKSVRQQAVKLMDVVRVYEERNRLPRGQRTVYNACVRCCEPDGTVRLTQLYKPVGGEWRKPPFGRSSRLFGIRISWSTSMPPQ